MISVPGGFDTVLVVDFGAQYAQLIARRVRECHVYSEIVPSTHAGGGDAGQAAEGDHLVRRPLVRLRRRRAAARPGGLFDAGVPVLGICYGFQLMVAGLGGDGGAHRRGASTARPGCDVVRPRRPCFAGPARTSQRVWMSHGDTCTAAPPGLRRDRATEATPVAAVENVGGGLYGVQFHPEVLHTEHGAADAGRSSSWPAAARPGPC